MSLPIIKTPVHRGIYLFRRVGDDEWRPTEVISDDMGSLCAYKTWSVMQFPTKDVTVYNSWTNVYAEIGLFVGEWILLQTSEPVPKLQFTAIPFK
jgi:hypothetical protein